MTMSLRDERILAGMPQVRFIAAHIYRQLPAGASFELADLVSIGTLGLIAAVDRFDDSLGVLLKTYADLKIRGAILDALRGVDPCSRAARQVRNQAARATHALAQQLGRKPEEHEVAAVLAIPIDSYRSEMARAHIESVNLDSLLPDGRQRVSDVLRDHAPTPEQRSGSRAISIAVQAAVAHLPERERKILQLSFFEGLPLRLIARRLGFQETRISQLRKSALARIRQELGISVIDSPSRRTTSQRARRTREAAGNYAPVAA